RESRAGGPGLVARPCAADPADPRLHQARPPRTEPPCGRRARRRRLPRRTRRSRQPHRAHRAHQEHRARTDQLRSIAADGLGTETALGHSAPGPGRTGSRRVTSPAALARPDRCPGRFRRIAYRRPSRAVQSRCMCKVRRSRRFRLALAWRRAPRAAMSSPLVVVVGAVTALLASFLATATPLHAQAAAGAALTERHGSVCEDQYGPVFTSPSVDPRDAQTVIDVVRDRASRHGFGAPVVSMFTPVGNAEFGGEKFDFRVGYRTGGTGDLELLRGNASPGLWMGTELADAEGIPLGTRGHEGLLPPTTGIYRDLHLPAPGPWCSVRDLSMPNRLVDTLTGPVLFATDRASFDTATRPFSELERLTVTFRTPPPSTLAEATDRLRRADALIADVEQTLRDDGHGALTHGSTPFARSVELAHQARANVGLSIAPLAVLAVLIGCTGAAVLGLQWYQRRHRQVRLHLTRGHRPAAVGGLALAELGAPILFGGALGV